MREIYIKNITQEEQTWGSKVYQPDEEYVVPQEDWHSLWSDNVLFNDLVDKAEVSDGYKTYSTKIEAWSWIRGTLPSEVTPLTIKNEHSMQPWGCIADYFESTGNFESQGDYICAITLSNMSQDGKTFTYNSDVPVAPAIGNYVFQRHNTRRSWITSFDAVNYTVTFEEANLSNGVGVYSKGFYIDCIVRDWKPLMYLWGMTLTVLEYDENNVLETNPCTDFLEFSIVDRDDLFKNDTFCSLVFADYGVTTALQAEPYLIALGFEDNGEYGHWTKYYDESWAVNCLGIYIATPDGSPGELLPGLYLRLSFFTTENEFHKYKIFIDYYPTAKD